MIFQCFIRHETRLTVEAKNLLCIMSQFSSGEVTIHYGHKGSLRVHDVYNYMCQRDGPFF